MTQPRRAIPARRTARRALAAFALTLAATTVTTGVAAAVGPPSAPTVTGVTSTLTAIQVTFTPGADNGSPITGFDATCTSSNGGVTGTQSGTTSPITVGALTTGKRYACSVTATNARGTSVPSLLGRATVGAPAAPAVLDVISLPQGIAVVVRKNTDNGSPVISYRARCTSSNGGLPGSPLQLASPVIATGLTPGATYTCAVTANNLRGESPAKVSAAVVVGDAFATTTCLGTTGTVTMSPGLRLVASATQSIGLAGTFGSCTGGYVTSARVAVDFRSAEPMRCENALVSTMTSGGYGRITWTAPAAMGQSGATVRFRFLSTSGHTTVVKFWGTVTQRANLFTERHISGRLTLNAGLAAVAQGGDCRAVTPLTSFGITALRFTIT